MDSLHRFNVAQRPHNRIQTLRSNVRVLCIAHGMQSVTDFFISEKGNTLALACGCRRAEKATREAA
jgi:hypothetical protein